MRVVFQSRRPTMKPDIQIIPKLWTMIPEAIRLFLPLTALTGLFSMYVRADIADTPANFWLIACTGVTVGLVISSIVVARQ